MLYEINFITFVSRKRALPDYASFIINVNALVLLSVLLCICNFKLVTISLRQSEYSFFV